MDSLGKIILIGMPGSGKTTIGQQLSEKLALPFRDLDSEIEVGEKLTVTKIFEEFGEEHFRKLEQSYLIALMSSNENFVLASGGGTPCFYDNLKLMLESGKVFYLSITMDVLIQRLDKTDVGKRPLLNQGSLKDILEQKLKERQSYYSKAHHTVKADEKVLSSILSVLEEEADRKSH